MLVLLPLGPGILDVVEEVAGTGAVKVVIQPTGIGAVEVGEDVIPGPEPVELGIPDPKAILS